METGRARRDELREAVAACRARGLKHAAAWACEQLYGLDDGGGDATTSGGGLAASGLDVMGMDDTYSLAMAYFDLGEYRRCAHTLRTRERRCRPFFASTRRFSGGEE